MDGLIPIETIGHISQTSIVFYLFVKKFVCNLKKMVSEQ